MNFFSVEKCQFYEIHFSTDKLFLQLVIKKITGILGNKEQLFNN